jgi:hypothetical protein
MGNAIDAPKRLCTISLYVSFRGGRGCGGLGGVCAQSGSDKKAISNIKPIHLPITQNSAAFVSVQIGFSHKDMKYSVKICANGQ